MRLSRDPRVCQLCMVRLFGGHVCVGNLHLTHFADALASIELERAETAARAASASGASLLCGDFKLTPACSKSFSKLTRRGWSPPCLGHQSRVEPRACRDSCSVRVGR